MKINPYLEVLIAASIWGTTGIFVKFLHLPSTTLTLIRAGVPVILIFFYFLLFKKKILHFGKSPIMLLASLLNGLRMFLYFIGFTATTVGNAVIILYTGPIFTAIFSSIALKEKLTARKIFLLFLAFTGIVIMYSNNYFSFTNKDFLGMTAILISTVINSITLVIFKNEIHKHSRLQTIYYQNLIPLIMFLPFIFINKPFPTLNQWTVGIFYAFLIGIVAYILFFSALKKIEVSFSAILSYMEVVSAILLAVIFLAEKITPNMLLGGGLILLSAILLNRYSKVPETVGD